ncbi:MAG: phospholipase A [Desulfobacterales bacterium]|nr:phospholipase A [Desulfobacterales bacterium]MDD4071876.1 phospholipase A [Desulfobacterales bacterium]MDD4391537.1 phospholipase A [Desulfobacterales bacterium]
MNQTAPVKSSAFFVFMMLCIIISGWPVPEIASADPADSTQTPSSPSQARSALTDRMQEEKKTGESPFVITPHRPNYLLPFTYNAAPNSVPFSIGEDEFDNVEVKFQISLKYQLIENIFEKNIDLYFAYTNQSYWQAYNKDASSPFRETTHEPEIWMNFHTDVTLFGITVNQISVGGVHQSNGRSGTLSRSWNRIYADIVFHAGNFYFNLKPWYRIPEEDKQSPEDTSGDDNPDIEKYLGYGELRALYNWKSHNFSMMLRNNLRGSENKGAISLEWSFPLFKRLKGFVQYFNGYGESLIDYNASTNRIGAGLLLTDFL